MLAHETRRNLGQGYAVMAYPFPNVLFFGFAPTTQLLGQVGIGYPFCVRLLVTKEQILLLDLKVGAL